jgi:SMODS and SLOG-associating 2TM effector domain 3
VSPHDVSLDDEHLPAAFQSADHASGENQELAARLVRFQLLCLIVAGLGGAIDLKISDDRINLGGLLSIIGFAGAMGLMLYTQASDAEGRWYRARAGAESVKTLAWRYAVGDQ